MAFAARLCEAIAQDLPAALERFGRPRPLVCEVPLEALGLAVEIAIGE